MKKIFVMIRDKLGDTLIAFQALAAYRAAHPDDVITLMVHAHYQPIFAKEPGYRLLPYHSSAQAFVWALWQRLACRRFDALVVLRGFGEKIVRLTKLLPATQRIHALSRFPEAFPDSPPLPSPACLSEQALIASAWRGLRVLDPVLPCPDRLSLPGLIAHYRQTPEIVVICPVSDEVRKNLSVEDVVMMLPLIRSRHHALNIKVLVRHSGEGGFVSGPLGAAEVVAFGSIERLLELLGRAAAYYGCDTGLYHVATAMGLPALVVFGPTQPHKIILPAQDAVAVRLVALGQAHCDNRACLTPVCVRQTVAAWASSPALAIPFPENCPLKKADAAFSAQVEISGCGTLPRATGRGAKEKRNVSTQ